jgi:DNA-binding NtrC family response regulator
MSNPFIRILLVDDEQELVDYLAKRLRKKGHEVVGVTSGKEAIAQVTTQIFDVAVLDLKMPEMDGIEVLKHLKEAQPYLQVVMLTGHGSMDSALESGRHDAFRFLVKPYEFENLQETLDEANASKKQQQKDAFQEKLKDIIAHTTEPHELMHETERLRRDYEQE